MIYKLQNGGVVKLQNAGSLPKWLQKLNAWANKNIPESNESVGEQILNSTIKQANNASTQEERDRIYKDSAKNNLAVTGQSLMMLPMLREFTTYGLLGGGLRLGTGLAGSKVGEYVLGKGGDWADKKLNTKFLGTTGRIVGGLGGWMGGSSATTPLFRNLAGKGITLHMPDETFNALRSAEFTKQFNSTKSTLPAQVKYYGPTMGKSYAAKTNPQLIDLDTWGRTEYDQLAKKYGYKDWREMILSDRGDYNAEYKQLIKDQIRRIQSDPKYNGQTIVVSNASLLKPNSGITFANTPVIPERSIMAIRNNSRHPWESIAHGESWWDSLQQKGTPLKIDNRFVSDIEGNKAIEFVPKTIDPQTAATTYHFDGTMPLSRPISQAERLGVPKGDRGLFDWGQISDLRPRFNKWAEYYGYDQIPESVELENAVDIMRNTFKRHNTFFRGVHKPDTPEDIAHIESLFGKGYNLDDVYKYVATHGRPGDNAVFVSPLSNAGIYGSTGKTAIVRRRFKLGRNPETWLQDADFDIIFGGSPEAIKVAQEKNTFTFPWSQRGNGIVENELLAPDGTINFIDFVPSNASTSYFDSNGSLNKYLGYKSFGDVYGFGDYNHFTDIPVEKPLQLTGHFGNPDIRYSKGNPTGSEIFAERYDGNPLRWNNINKDISVGRTEAINYLNSKRKQLTDQHNIDIAKRLFNVDITPEPNPGIRASTDMQFTSTPILNGTWYPKFGVRLTFDPNNTTKGNTVFNYRDPTLDEISLDLSSDLEDAALHEWLHRGNIGEGRGDITRAFYKWKTQKLLKPEFWNDEYFGNPQEATTNLIEIGRRNGITNAKYPGFNKAIEQLRYIIDNDINKGYLLNKTRWETKPKRVWDALQGKYMGLIPIGLGTTLMLNENE